jgi:hypothetical protein
MTIADRAAIAARLRGLLGGQDHGDLEQTSERLRVDEVSLRMSIDELAPYPTVDVLAAVVREYGVDPSWLLTGTYDSSTHRRVLEADTRTIASALQQLSSQRNYPDLPNRTQAVS